jgi:flagellar motor switch protein FliN
LADGSDDLLDPNEIEALLNAGKEDAPTPAEAPSALTEPETPPASNELLNPDDIEALLNDPSLMAEAAAPAAANPSPEAMLEQAEAQLAAAVQPNLGGGIPSELGAPAPYTFESFGSPSNSSTGDIGWDALHDVELDLRIELGRTELLIEELLKLQEGAVVPLDKLAGDPVDILVNGQLVARGEVLVLNDNFCVRVAEILAPES